MVTLSFLSLDLPQKYRFLAFLNILFTEQKLRFQMKAEIISNAHYLFSRLLKSQFLLRFWALRLLNSFCALRILRSHGAVAFRSAGVRNSLANWRDNVAVFSVSSVANGVAVESSGRKANRFTTFAYNKASAGRIDWTGYVRFSTCLVVPPRTIIRRICSCRGEDLSSDFICRTSSSEWSWSRSILSDSYSPLTRFRTGQSTPFSSLK